MSTAGLEKKREFAFNLRLQVRNLYSIIFSKYYFAFDEILSGHHSQTLEF